MTKEELIEKLTELAVKPYDIEIAHSDADLLLLEYIDDERVTDAYHKIEKWYS